MKRWVRYWVLALIFCLWIGLAPVVADSPDFLLLGKQQYEAGHYHEALQSWQRVALRANRLEQHAGAQNTEARKRQVEALRYSAIAHQNLGQWEQAELSIEQALTFSQLLDDAFLQAQALTTRGSIQLQRGDPQSAYATYRQAERIHRMLGDSAGSILSQLNQVQALQRLGFYTRAHRLLFDIKDSLEHTPDPTLKIQHLRSLGSVLQNVGEMEQAQGVLNQALVLAQEASDPAALAMVRFQLGNLAQIQQNWSEAQQYYEAIKQWSQAEGERKTRLSRKRLEPMLQYAVQPSLERQYQVRLGIESELQQLRVAITSNPLDETISQETLQAIIAQARSIQAQLRQLPPSHWVIDAQVHWVESLLLLSQSHQPNLEASLKASQLAPSVWVQQLTQALHQAQQLQDLRAESAVLGQLGSIYEQNFQYGDALKFTQQALATLATIHAPDLSALWHWQLARVLQHEGKKAAALDHYQSSVSLLQSLRQDLVAMTPDLQFSFRDQVEPVYRQQVQLLLEDVDQLPPAEKQRRLEQSRQTIEALQLAELQNFFREACRTYEPRSIDQIDPQAAVAYSLVLDGRLEVVLSLPNQPLKHYGSDLSQAEAQTLLTHLRQSLNPAFRPEDGLVAAQQLYDRLIRPAEPDLDALKIETLIFVLDDFLRSVPMAALHDGDRYLVEKYNLALTPGLQLFESQHLSRGRTRLLAGGLSEARPGFVALPGVQQELEMLSEQAQAKVLLNQNFVRSTLSQKLQDSPFSVIHLATHGQFSSRAQDTFLLAWDDRISVKEFDQWLSQRNLQRSRRSPLELLTLSACQTAKGDDRATLGMAGMAVRSGARTTVATLWSVQDQSTSELMQSFYQQLFEQGTGRAEALRQAQLQLLHGKYSHPYYWAPFVMVGNWQ